MGQGGRPPFRIVSIKGFAAKHVSNPFRLIRFAKIRNTIGFYTKIQREQHSARDDVRALAGCQTYCRIRKNPKINETFFFGGGEERKYLK